MKLTIVAPNRDRLDFTQPASRLFLKSIQWQDCLNFNLLLVDGGSKNYDELKSYIQCYDQKIPVHMIQYKLGKDFNKPILDNFGIRNAKTEYIMTTDVDIVFAPQFVSELIKLLEPNVMVESRAMYWYNNNAESIYKSDKNQYNIEELRVGVIKKRTTCGACQCMHHKSWERIRGFDEQYYGWGSEDYDLYYRARLSGLKAKWMGESLDSIMVFHQPHFKSNEQIREDLKTQEVNKRRLANVRSFVVNPNGWGGIYE